MGCYRKAKLALDALRSYTSKIVTRPSVEKSAFSRIHQDGSLSSSSNPVKLSGFSKSCNFYQRFGPGSQMGVNKINCNPFLGNGIGAKRFYYVDRYRVQHFKPRGPKRWFRNPRTVLIVVLVGSGAFITVYFGNLENVPYTKRKHFVLLSKTMERKMGETQFEQMRAAFKGKILPALHPESVRTRLIAQDIIDALQRGLKREQVWSDMGYASQESDMAHEASAHETLKALSEREEKIEGKWYKEDEILDDNWVQQCRKKEKGLKADASHLDGLNWEILVVNEPVVNAFCLPGGKIVVYTGLLEQFKTDAEIATIIGHEVGHAVARHAAEGITKNLWVAILQLILYQFIMPDIANAMSVLFLRLPFSRSAMDLSCIHPSHLRYFHPLRSLRAQGGWCHDIIISRGLTLSFTLVWAPIPFPPICWIITAYKLTRSSMGQNILLLFFWLRMVHAVGYEIISCFLVL